MHGSVFLDSYAMAAGAARGNRRAFGAADAQPLVLLQAAGDDAHECLQAACSQQGIVFHNVIDALSDIFLIWAQAIDMGMSH